MTIFLKTFLIKHAEPKTNRITDAFCCIGKGLLHHLVYFCLADVTWCETDHLSLIDRPESDSRHFIYYKYCKYVNGTEDIISQKSSQNDKL
uniref:Uncharacterized protein n=1 Tax=Romanomermis culicivorax TaxID=13658 RepID=A0A915ITB7_ROMCU